MRRFIRGLGLVIFVMAGVGQNAAGQLIQEAHADGAGRMHIRLKNGAEKIVPPSAKEQVAADGIKISPDGSAVGWLVEVPNCCTSYPIPLEIRVYAVGGRRRHFSDGMMVSEWTFVDGGRQIAYYTDTVHSSLAPKCVLADVRSGKTLKRWAPGDGPIPDWAQNFAADLQPDKVPSP